MKKKIKIILLIMMILVSIIIGINIYIKATEHTRESEYTGDNAIDRAIENVYTNNSFSKGYIRFADDLHEVKEDVVIDSRLGIMEYNDITYYKQLKYVEASDVGEKLDKRMLLLKDNAGEVEVEIYKILDISTELAVAVKRVDSESYYLFNNPSYAPKDMKKFMEAFGINKDTKVLEVNLYVSSEERYINYSGVPIDYILDNILNKSGDITNDAGCFMKTTGLTFGVSIRSLGERIVIRVTEDGNICVDGIFLQYAFEFDGGEDKISRAVDFVNYINDNYEGKLE